MISIAPNLVRSRDRCTAQQIRVDLVTGFRLRRTRSAIKRLDFHPLHQRLHVPTADLVALANQQTMQHPRPGERMLQMQPVETTHHLQVACRHRARQIIDTAAADAQDLRLFADRKSVFAVDHRLALSKPALLSAPSKKLVTALRAPCGIETGSR